MSKLSFAGISLVGAIPAGFLAYVLIMVMLGNFENLTTMMQVFIWPALLVSVVIALMPVIIMVFMPKSLPVATFAVAGAAGVGGMTMTDEDSSDEETLFAEDSGEFGDDEFGDEEYDDLGDDLEVEEFEDSDYDDDNYDDLGNTEAFDGFEVEDDGLGATKETELEDFDDSEEFDLFDKAEEK